MKPESLIITVPRAGNRKFRVFGLNPGHAELHFLMSVGDRVPDHLDDVIEII